MPNPKDPTMPRTPDPTLPNPMDPDFLSRPGDNRAQPGDVLGVERDGETTHLGETREDEDERRVDAEEAVEDDRPSSRPH